MREIFVKWKFNVRQLAYFVGICFLCSASKTDIKIYQNLQVHTSLYNSIVKKDHLPRKPKRRLYVVLYEKLIDKLSYYNLLN